MEEYIEKDYTLSTDHVDHPNNAEYTVDIGQAAAIMGVCVSHARNQMQNQRIKSRKLMQVNGVPKWFTTRENIATYRANLRPRGRKPGTATNPQARMYKVALTHEQYQRANELLVNAGLPGLGLARVS